MFISLTRRVSIAVWKMLKKLNAWALKPYHDAGYVIRRKATILYYFCVSLVILMPFFLTIYAIWIPQRLPIAGPPMLASMAIGLTCLFILSSGRFYLAGQTLAFVAFLIIALAQYRKLEGEYFTAYSTFIHLFAIPILVVGLFGRKRYILPMYAVMVIANVVFFGLLRPKIDGEYLIAAQVGLMTSVIALTLITTLLYLLRNVMDSAVTEVEKTNASLNRFVPTEFLQLLNRKNIHEVGLGDHTEQEMTILFADIRNFTGISETLSPAENFSFINDYLSVMGPIIRENNGFIDKYIGDAVMALFPSSAEDALEAALAMHDRVSEWNQRRAQHNYAAVKIGIGIHQGRVMLGTIGEHQRMDGTVIADAVNLASRIESLTKNYGAGTLISDFSWQSVKDKHKYDSRLVDRVAVKGKNEPVDLIEVFNSDVDDLRKLKLRQKAAFAAALDLYRRGNFSDAKNAFLQLAAENAHDRTLRLYLERIERYIQYPPREWLGFEVLTEK